MRTIRVLKPNTMSLTYKQIQEEVAARLRDLRKTVANDMSPEDVAVQAVERGIRIAPRTIRQWEEGSGTMRLDKLFELLSFYRVSLGDFFRFAVESEDGRLVADLFDVARKPQARKAFRELFRVLREK